MITKILPYNWIDSVQSFIRVIDELEAIYGPELRDPSVSRWSLFRGHNDELYQPEPAIYRDFEGESVFYTNEQLMIQEVIRLMPTEFERLSAFQILAKLQHYGLPTRLLDVTTNPLVALFFACGGSEEVDGEVVVFPNQSVYREDSAQVEWLSRWAINGTWGPTSEGSLMQAVGYDSTKNRSALIEHSEPLEALTQRFTAVRPMHTNERLKAQSGAFLIAGLEIDRRAEQNLFVRPHRGCIGEDTGRDTTLQIHEPRIIVTGESKSRILRQLDRLNINFSTLFPEPQNIIRYVHDGFKNHIFGETNVSRRIDTSAVRENDSN
ncbi:FRG domain-containing protein [Corynebacterium fournieri]|uniref:FRG domain-containing protein n=1 Tax=Corynebacterium fournieri TaxID=1852390 RepID=UPI000A2F6543|nr:FRG domain-containing protein [Corynebacterium fournieri]WJY98602.1 FRG domain protein [Corynebacterium fournieri]